MSKMKLLLITTMLMLASCNSKAALATVDDTRPDQITATDIDDDSSEPDDDIVTDTDDDATSTEHHKVYVVEDLVTYYNDTATEDEQVVYNEAEDYWFYSIAKIVEDESKETLQHEVHHYLDYVPMYSIIESGYMFRYKEHYDETENSYTYVAVSSNWFAAITISSCINSSELTTDVIIYDGRNGLHV